MPEYKIPKFSTEELLAAFGSQVSPAGVIGAGRKGFAEGVSLAETIEGIKSKKLKQQQEVAEIERKLKAQEMLAKTVEGKPEIERKKVALQALAPKHAIRPEKEQVPMELESFEHKKGMEEIKSEIEKRKLLSTAIKAGLPPEKAIAQLYPSETLTRATAPMTLPMINITTGERLTAIWNPVDRTFTSGDRVLDPSEWIRDYKPDIRTEPGTEELLRITSAGTTSPLTGAERRPEKGKPVTNLSQLSAFEKNEAIRTKQDFQTDPTAKLLSGDLTTLLVLEDLIKKRPKGAVGLTRTQLTVFAGEKGRLTDDDIRRNSGSPAIADRLIRTYNDLVHGNLSTVDSKDFKIIVDLVGAKKALELDNILSDYTTAIGLQTPNSEKFVKRYVSSGTWSKIERNLKNVNKLSDITPEKMQSSGGYTYTVE